ncbi:MAG TPA: serine hydrolase domain-containing protein [Chitinophagaceae bacterium]|nr:serine hydrolase domain-containing protein [Chitinophagaceae bacterium]
MKQLLLSFSLFINIISFSQTWQDTLTRIEKAFERYKPTLPGAQICIARKGTILFSKAYGMADMEHNVSLNTESRIEAGSVSKQFTAAAILLLEQDGKLSLNDNVRKYIPELPDYGTPITLRHMMQHTSGLKDWGAVGGMAGWPRSSKTYNNEDALYIASIQKSLNHVPGAEFLYSNTNYNLFAVIVERVSGLSLADFTSKRIFEPAGMTHTEWRANYRKIVPNRAIAYSKDGTGYYTNMPNEYVYGNGGLLTTAEDLVKWNDYYQSGKLGSHSLLPKQLALTALTGGHKNAYAAGLFITEKRGWSLITHDGATAGYRCNLDYYPSMGLSMAWISNSSEFDNDNGALIASLTDIFIPDNSKKPSDPQPAYAIAPALLSTYEGWYRSSRSNNAFRFYVKDNKLLVTGVGELIPRADNKFSIGNSANIYTFTGQPQKELLFIRELGDSIYFSRQDSAIVTAQAMKEYTGTYYSDEVEASNKIEYKNDVLTLTLMGGRGSMTLAPTSKDAFTGGGGALIFERDKKGEIISYSYSIARARNMIFRRTAK